MPSSAPLRRLRTTLIHSTALPSERQLYPQRPLRRVLDRQGGIR